MLRRRGCHFPPWTLVVRGNRGPIRASRRKAFAEIGNTITVPDVASTCYGPMQYYRLSSCRSSCCSVQSRTISTDSLLDLNIHNHLLSLSLFLFSISRFEVHVTRSVVRSAYVSILSHQTAILIEGSTDSPRWRPQSLSSPSLHLPAPTRQLAWALSSGSLNAQSQSWRDRTRTLHSNMAPAMRIRTRKRRRYVHPAVVS